MATELLPTNVAAAWSCEERSFELSLMTPMFDIFARLPDGQPLWIGSVEELEEARERVTGLAVTRPGRYFIYSERTGDVIEKCSSLPTQAPTVEDSGRAQFPHTALLEG